jgi:hypothetical protein
MATAEPKSADPKAQTIAIERIVLNMTNLPFYCYAKYWGLLNEFDFRQPVNQLLSSSPDGEL